VRAAVPRAALPRAALPRAAVPLRAGSDAAEPVSPPAVKAAALERGRSNGRGWGLRR
jgi:hypothetical protein